MRKQIEQTLDSREVAEMVEKKHADLMRDIRRYAEQLAESKIALGDFFRESSYMDSNNQERPCYTVTKKGCEFIAHKLTGIKGTEFTARYINRFHDMEEQLQQPRVPVNPIAGLGLSPQLQAMINLELKQREQDQKLAALEDKATRQTEALQAVKDAMVSPETEESFSAWTTRMIKTIAESPAMAENPYRYQTVWGETYKRLEAKAGCRLEVLLKNAKKRAADRGATKSAIKSISKLSIISEDKRLKELYITCIREMLIAYCVEVA